MADDPEDDGPRRAGPVFDPSLSVPAFDLVRDPSRRSALSSRELQIFDATVERCRSQLEALGVLAGFAEQQQKELAALVLDLDDRYSWWQGAKDWHPRLKKISKRGPGHARKLLGKLDRVRRDLKGLVDDSQVVDPFFADQVVPPVTQVMPTLEGVSAALKGGTTQKDPDRMRDWYRQSRSQHPQPHDPRPDAANQLVAYFRGSASLKAADADVRTAKIGNAFWQWEYDFQINASKVEECAAVRMLLRRRKPRPQGTRKKKRP